MPNPSEIDKLAMLKGLYSQYQANVKENRQFYNLDFKASVVPPPAEGDRDDLWAVMATTARRAIDDPSDHILPFPRIKVPIRPTENSLVEEQMSAELRRDFLNAWWECEENEYSILSSARKVLLNEGRVVVRKTLKWNSIPDYPGKMATPAERQKFRRAMGKLGQYDFLWRLELLDNLTVYEDPSNPRDPQYVFVEHEVLAEEAKRLFPNADVPTDDYSSVKYLEYWTKPTYKFDGTYEEGEFKQFIDDKLVKTSVNPYPYIPIIIEDSGFGVSYHLAKPHDRYVGMTQFTHDIFIAESRQLTTMENVAEITGFAPLMTRNMPPEKELSVGPRSVIRLDGGPEDTNRETAEYLIAPPVPITVPQVIQLTQQMANATLKFDTLGGTPQRGIETATEADQSLKNSAAKLQGPVNGLNRVVNKVSRWVLMDVDLVIGSKITVYGTMPNAGTVTIGPRDIKGFYTVQGELTTSDEDAVEMTKARFWMDAYRATPFLSAMTAMERGGVSDEPMKELVKRSAEDVYLSDLMRQARVMVGGQMFGVLNSMIQQIASGETGELPAGAAPQDNLVSQEGITSPVQDRIRTEGLASRDARGGQYQA